MTDHPQHVPTEKIQIRKLTQTIRERRPVQKQVTIIIPTLGRDILEECLVCIALGESWPEKLVLVDQGENESVRDWVSYLNSMGLQTEHIFCPPKGKSFAANLGAEHVETRFIGFTDDDCLVHTQWLETMAGTLSNEPEWFVTGRVDPAGNETLSIVTTENASVHTSPGLLFDHLAGGNMGVATDIFKEVGGFDVDLKTSEDGELAYRALRAGYSIAYVPEMIVRHYGWRTPEQEFTRLQNYARGHGLFYGKYLRKGDLRILLRTFIHLLRALRRWLKGWLKGDKQQAMAGYEYLSGLLPGVFGGLLNKRDVFL